MVYIVIGLLVAFLALFLVAAAMDADSKNKVKTKEELEREMQDVTSPVGCLCALTVILTGALIMVGLFWLLSFSDRVPTVPLPWSLK